jgi:zinc/manganese transport system substrate-binding protein
MKTLVFIFFVSFFIQNAQGNTDVPLNIQTSVPYLQELAGQVTCFSPLFKIKSVLNTSDNPHHFYMSPIQRASLERAQVVLMIGSGFEPWLQKISFQRNQTLLAVTHNLADPHIWHSPSLTKQTVIQISHLLQRLCPSKSAHITRCTTQYLNALAHTVNHLKQELQVIPSEHKVLATNHDALGYFAKEFGFRVMTLLGISNENSLSPVQLKKMMINLKKENVPAIFLESTGNMRNIQTVSKETGIKIGGTLYADSLGPKGSGAETTLGLWQTNVNTILNALKK